MYKCHNRHNTSVKSYFLFPKNRKKEEKRLRLDFKKTKIKKINASYNLHGMNCVYIYVLL